MKKIILIGSVVGALLLTACSSGQKSEASMKQEKTKTQDMKEANDMKKTDDTKAFHLKDLKGNMVNLSDYKGKKVYVKFWASWCPLCLAGLQDVNQLAAEKHDFVVLSIVAPNVNGEKNAKDFKEWFQGLSYDKLPVLLDENGTYTKDLGVRGYPTSAFYNTSGELKKVQPGQLDNDKIMDIISTLN